MRVLVTGAGGLVGSAIARHLQRAGHEVVGVARDLTGRGEALETAVSLDLGAPGAAATLNQSQPPCQAIVHAAASTALDPFAAAVSLTNGLGTQQMLELAVRWRVRSFVYVSSIGVIGRPVEIPITERHPVQPVTAYHASKLYGEHLVRVVCGADIPGVCLRITAPVGPGMPAERILPTFVTRAAAGRPLELAGRGTRAQDYVDVRDVARAVAASIQTGATGILNVGSGRCVSNRQLAECCVALLSSSSEIRVSGSPDVDDGVRWEVSISEAARQLGYKPSCSLEDSILQLAKFVMDRSVVA